MMSVEDMLENMLRLPDVTHVELTRVKENNSDYTVVVHFGVDCAGYFTRTGMRRAVVGAFEEILRVRKLKLEDAKAEVAILTATLLESAAEEKK